MSDPKAPAETPGEDSPDARLVRELADVLNQTELSEIEFERGDLKIRVARTLAAAPTVLMAAPPAPAAPSPAPAEAEPAAPARPAGETVKSPMVGTVYLQSPPGPAPLGQ